MNIENDIFPDVIRIESTGMCNFQCTHCPTGLGNKMRGELTQPMFEKVVKQFEERKIIPRVVVLYHAGEPLLNKKLPDFIKYLKKIGVKKTVITTNGSLLGDNMSEKLIDAGLDELKVTFAGESIQENDEIRRNGNFVRDGGNIINLCKIKKEKNKSNPSIHIGNTRICDKKTILKFIKNESTLRDSIPNYIKEFFREVGESVTFFSYPAMQWPGYTPIHFDILRFPNKKLSYCKLLFETLTILSNGDVVPCCYDLKGEQVFGNVFEKNIFRIWDDGLYSDFRSKFKRGVHSSICMKCNVLSPRYLIKKK